MYHFNIQLIRLAFWYMNFAVLQCCSPVPGTEPSKLSMSQVLQGATMVLSGTDVDHQQRNDGRRNYTFDVSCIFKSNITNIPSTIFLLDVGAISCDQTRMDPVGKSYIVAVKVATPKYVNDWAMNANYFGKDSDVPYYFIMDEPDILNPAAFEVTPASLNVTSRLCGMNNTIVSVGQGAGGHVCPQRTVTDTTCVQASGASRGTLSLAAMIIHVCLLMIGSTMFLV